MIWGWLSWIATSRVGRLIGAAVAAMTFFYAYGKLKRQEGYDDAKRDASEDSRKRIQKGRDAVRDGRDGDPAERLRRNEGRWD